MEYSIYLYLSHYNWLVSFGALFDVRSSASINTATGQRSWDRVLGIYLSVLRHTFYYNIHIGILYNLFISSWIHIFSINFTNQIFSCNFMLFTNSQNLKLSELTLSLSTKISCIHVQKHNTPLVSSMQYNSQLVICFYYICLTTFRQVAQLFLTFFIFRISSAILEILTVLITAYSLFQKTCKINLSIFLLCWKMSPLSGEPLNHVSYFKCVSEIYRH